MPDDNSEWDSTVFRAAVDEIFDRAKTDAETRSLIARMAVTGSLSTYSREIMYRSLDADFFEEYEKERDKKVKEYALMFTSDRKLLDHLISIGVRFRGWRRWLLGRVVYDHSREVRFFRRLSGGLWEKWAFPIWTANCFSVPYEDRYQSWEPNRDRGIWVPVKEPSEIRGHIIDQEDYRKVKPVQEVPPVASGPYRTSIDPKGGR